MALPSPRIPLVVLLLSSLHLAAEMLGDAYLKKTPLPSLSRTCDMSSRSRIMRRTDTHHSSPLTRLLNVQAAQLAALLIGN